MHDPRNPRRSIAGATSLLAVALALAACGDQVTDPPGLETRVQRAGANTAAPAPP